MKIKICNLKRCHPNTKRVLKKLTLYQCDESKMFEIITSNWDDRHVINIAICYIEGKIVGWASDWTGTKTNDNHWICCFVKPECRRKGVGTALCNKLIERKKFAFGKAWDLESEEFWESIKNKNKYFNVVR